MTDGPSPLPTLEAFAERLTQELRLQDWRALLVLVHAAPHLHAEIQRVCEDLVVEHGLHPDQLEVWPVQRSERGRRILAGHNRARETSLARRRLICWLASSPEDVRFFREVAPDLTAALDLTLEVRRSPDPTLASWEVSRQQICDLMRERHGTLDFTGLLPADVERRELPLAELYQNLVDLDLEAEPPDRTDEPRTRKGWLVLGQPGTGKTTFVRHLAWTYAQGGDDPLEIGPKVPVLLSLADYALDREQQVRSLVEFLPAWLATHGITATDVTAHLGDVLLLLDGLDEMRSPQARQAVLDEVTQLVSDERVGGVVVTGRSYLVDELRARSFELRLVSTRRPKPEQVRAFIAAFVRLRRGREGRDADLYHRIMADADLRALAQTPLVLAFLLVLDQIEGRLPDRRIEIYYRLGEMLIDRWTRARSLGAGDARQNRPTRADALRVIGPLAWWTLERGGTVPESGLLEELKRIEALREEPAEAERRAHALLELLRSDTALLVPRFSSYLGSYRFWSFVHGSIGEYFAGVDAERDPRRWKALMEDPYRADWREIVLFCAGQLGLIDGRVERLDELVGAILAQSRRAGRYGMNYPSLLIGLLGESPGLSRRQIDALVARLLDFVFTKYFVLNARLQVQLEFVWLLERAEGAVQASLAATLREWLTVRPASVKWDGVFLRMRTWQPFGPPMVGANPFLSVPDETKSLVSPVLGPVVASFVEPWWAEKYGIDFKPVAAVWAERPADDGAYRLARLWLQLVAASLPPAT